MQQLFVEAVVVGIATVIMGTIVSWALASIAKMDDLPPVCKDWNKNYVMEIALFFTGFCLHLLFEAVGANGWYCLQGFACK